MKPHQKSKALLEEFGYIYQNAERSRPMTFKKEDAFGLIDMWGLKEGELLCVQATSYTNISHHYVNYLTDPKLHKRLALLLTIPGVHFVIHGWNTNYDDFEPDAPHIVEFYLDGGQIKMEYWNPEDTQESEDEEQDELAWDHHDVQPAGATKRLTPPERSGSSGDAHFYRYLG